MNIVQRIRGWVRTRAETLTVVKLTEQHGAPEPRRLKYEEEYVMITLKRAYIVKSMRFGSDFHSSVHAHVKWTNEERGDTEFRTVIAPDVFKEVDQRAARRLMQGDRRILWYVPVTGPLELDLGLFAVQGGNFTWSYVKLLSKMSEAAGVSFVGQVAPYVDLLREGSDMLFGTEGDNELLVGYANEDMEMSTGWTLVMQRPVAEMDLAKLRIESDYAVREGKKPLIEWPYFLVEIATSQQHRELGGIPELREAWGELNKAYLERGALAARSELERYQRLCRVSPDLTPADGKRRAEWAARKFAEYEGTGTTSGTGTAYPFGEHEIGDFYE